MSTDAGTEWVVSTFLINAGALATSAGLNWSAILHRQNVSTRALSAPDRRIGLRQAFAVFNDVARTAGDPTLLLNGFARLPLGAGDLMDYLALYAPDTRSALFNWAHYAPLCSRGIGLSLHPTSSHFYLVLSVPNRFGANSQASFAMMGLIAGRLGHLLGDESRSVQMEIAALDPAEAGHEVDLGHFRGGVTFEAPENRIRVPYALAEQPNPHADRNLLRLIEIAANRLMQDINAPSDPVAQIAATIASGMEQGDLTIDTVASSLGLSPRTLQRLLGQAGTSFREVLEDVRRTTAESYLLDTRRPIKEIAYLLGFSNLSTFSRAVKNWFGVAPRELRRQALDETPDGSAQTRRG
ncbi:helix-turn-helix transcriptional regulator [Roseibium aestuarii]|uniref:Helix-turn-helix domain-containing protein n=1 Tax=Roseibium aestuarii TaxID=2600299 RepID=A0ABW4JV56_9HYPH|nr:AraC family transcriptional regulator [Roseibium aestuarii]